MHLINNVDENKIFFTERQQAEAKRARELFNPVGFRSVKYTKETMQMDLF